MRKFEIPVFYKSPILSRIKLKRRLDDPRKKDFSPTILDLGEVRLYLARHFGFCYGVENAIEIAYRAIEENTGKRIFLLSEMIHNPAVNEDLKSRGIQFLMDTAGEKLIDWNTLSPEDIVIIPAFGTTVEIEQQLRNIGINPYKYNTTCPFVEKVWNKAAQLGTEDYTIIIHGKHYHEETRATFSHTNESTVSVIVRDIKEAEELAEVITGKKSESFFREYFNNRYSKGFNPAIHFNKIGVVNQTTMLATETEDIAMLLKEAMIVKYGKDNIKDHFADTRDTLCYATNDNQDATYELLKTDADIAIVVGGYNSSNTGHIVELCEEKFKTFFISSAEEIISKETIRHFDLNQKKIILTENFLPDIHPVKIAVTSGASCPDAVVDEVIRKIVSYFPEAINIEELV